MKPQLKRRAGTDRTSFPVYVNIAESFADPLIHGNVNEVF